MNSKQRCLAAISGEPVDRVPVFPLLMFFAQNRLGVTYREFATNGHVLAEAQLNIINTFGVDAITACSDAFRITADLGADMVFPEYQTPFAASPLVATRSDLNRLIRPDPTDPKTRMNDRVRATQDMVRAAGDDCLVLGWVDMPFAEACSVCGVSQFMMMLYDDPVLAHEVLDYLTKIVIDFCLAQLEVGTPMIGAGDAAASLLSPASVPGVRVTLRAAHLRGGACLRRHGEAAYLRQHDPHLERYGRTRRPICSMWITWWILRRREMCTTRRKSVSRAISTRSPICFRPRRRRVRHGR